MGLNQTAKRRWGLGIVGIISILLLLLAWPREDIVLSKIGIDEPLKVRRGLDLQGGVYLVYEAKIDQLPEGEETKTAELLANAASVIERRVNPSGTSEVAVRTAAGNRIVVELPGLDSPEAAKELIGRTAQLQFIELPPSSGEPESSGQQFLPTNISGEDIRRATVDFSQTTGGQPIVNLELKGGQSTENFAELTGRLSQSGGQLVTLLDDQVVFGPASVQQAITDGQAQLTGGFDLKGAKEIATLLNAGALPVPIELVAQQTIGPSLGAESIQQSLLAGLIGLLSVSAFLFVYYRRAGIVAIGSLIFYTLALIVIFKLSVFTSFVLVLTLAGVAGFILSIAVAVDTNILIFERVKEELNRGTLKTLAFEDGFKHAWTSIRDANVATLISTAILYSFGTPVIRGFAVTLGIGVLLNLITAQSVTKVLMRWLVRSRFSNIVNWISAKGEKQ